MAFVDRRDEVGVETADDIFQTILAILRYTCLLIRSIVILSRCPFLLAPRVYLPHTPALCFSPFGSNLKHVTIIWQSCKSNPTH